MKPDYDDSPWQKTVAVSTPTPRASESGHWYQRDGTPVYEVPGADGKKMVTPDIRHARKMGLLPGATTIIGCADKPGLTVWKIEQSILSSMTLPRRPHEPDTEFIKRVVEDSQEQGKKAKISTPRSKAALRASLYLLPMPSMLMAL